MASTETLPLSVAIPTLGRDAVLTDTIEQLLQQSPAAAELLIVDQTAEHDAATTEKLTEWDRNGSIRWIRREVASQPAALNAALATARSPLLLMLDDDIRIEPGFLQRHTEAFEDDDTWAVVGQVLQPGEVPVAPRPSGKLGALADLDFAFNSDQPAWVTNGMSGNMTVRVARAVELGGFDENFLPPVSYRFDADFCKRLVRAGGRIRFEPRARIHHLRAARGGTRSVGSHLNSASPVHGMGDYYFALQRGFDTSTLVYMLRRPLREVLTRYHARRPWWIPIKLVGELRAFLRALRMWRRGPRYLAGESKRG